MVVLLGLILTTSFTHQVLTLSDYLVIHDVLESSIIFVNYQDCYIIFRGLVACPYQFDIFSRRPPTTRFHSRGDNTPTCGQPFGPRSQSSKAHAAKHRVDPPGDFGLHSTLSHSAHHCVLRHIVKCTLYIQKLTELFPFFNRHCQFCLQVNANQFYRIFSVGAHVDFGGWIPHRSPLSFQNKRRQANGLICFSVRVVVSTTLGDKYWNTGPQYLGNSHRLRCSVYLADQLDQRSCCFFQKSRIDAISTRCLKRAKFKAHDHMLRTPLVMSLAWLGLLSVPSLGVLDGKYVSNNNLKVSPHVLVYSPIAFYRVSRKCGFEALTCSLAVSLRFLTLFINAFQESSGVFLYLFHMLFEQIHSTKSPFCLGALKRFFRSSSCEHDLETNA